MDPFDWGTPQELEAKFLGRLDILVGDDILRIAIEVLDDRVIISGEVYSENARSQAVRLLAAFLSHHSIEDRIDVVGVFEPANDDSWFLKSHTAADFVAGYSPSEQKQAPRSIAKVVERYPHLACDGELAAGRTVTVIVDLSEQMLNPNSPRIALATLEPGWGSLEVDVAITSMAFSSKDLQGRITVYEDGASEPARIAATIRNELPPNTPVEVTAMFTVEGRFCGHNNTILGNVLEERCGLNAEPSVGPVLLAREVAPAMTVMIKSVSEQELHWNWVFGPAVPAPSGPLAGVAKLGSAPRAYAGQLMQKCPEMMPEDLKRQMGSIGETIWEATPSEFRAAYTHVRDKLGVDFPIQFILDEFHIPWEMMRPVGCDHIFMTHPVARWPLRRGDYPPFLPKGEKVTFVPCYPNGETLPAAEKEQQWLVLNLGARTASPRKSTFLDLLAAGDDVAPVALVHFAGHGTAATEKADAALRMEDASVGILDVNVSETLLGERDRSLIVLNACESASVSQSLSWVEGWAPAMIGRGFGGLIAPLWRVQDSAACDVITSGLQALYKDGQTLGAAFTSARAKVAKTSAAAFAFMTYGDVMARATP